MWNKIPIIAIKESELKSLDHLGFVDSLSSVKDISTTVVHAVALLRCFTKQDVLLGNKALSERLGLHPTTIARLTKTLCGLGLLQHDSVNRKYKLGYGTLALGYPMLANLKERHVARRLMKDLTDKTGGQTSMAALAGLEAIYLESFRPNSEWIEQPEIGATRPVMETAIGHSLLFSLESKRFEYLMKLYKDRFPSQYTKHRKVIEQSFKCLDTKGYCLALGTYQPTLHAIAMPLWTHSQQEPIAFNLSIRFSNESGNHIESYASAIQSLRDQVRQFLE